MLHVRHCRVQCPYLNYPTLLPLLLLRYFVPVVAVRFRTKLFLVHDDGRTISTRPIDMDSIVRTLPSANVCTLDTCHLTLDNYVLLRKYSKLWVSTDIKYS
jgi:hypothetical protein